MKIIANAKKYIYIQTPYFVLDESLKDALTIAAHSGVDVKVMIPEISDHMFVKSANRAYAGDILEASGSVYVYWKGFLHAKMLVADDEVVTYGLMMCAVVAGALFSFVSAKASRDYSAVEITSAMAIVGSAGFNTVNILRGNFFQSYSAIFIHWEVAVGILFLAVFCSALCYIGLNKVLAVLNPAIANNMIGSSITIIGVIAGVVINGDSAGVYTVIGVSLTVIGVWLSSKGIEELEQGKSG